MARTKAQAPTVAPIFPDFPNLKPQLGWDAEARYRINEQHFVQARWFGVDDYSAAAEFSFPPSFSRFYFDSRLQSAELNLFRESDTWWSVGAGLRYVGLEGVFRNEPFPGGFPGIFQTLATKNRLYGGQLTAEALLLQRGRLSIDGYAKAGLYYNDASYDEVFANFFGGSVRRDDRVGKAAFVGDLGVTAAFQLTDRIALRGGLQLLWLGGVAEPGNQQTLLAFPIDANDSVFYYGGTGAVEITF